MIIKRATSAFYDHWAINGQEAGHSAISRHFEAAFAPGARVLDVGCGMGRDLAVLLETGFDAYGVEPHDAMRARAVERHPHLAGRIAAASLPQLGLPFGGGFDAIVCSAVLMHVPASALPASLAAFGALLAPRACVLMALPEMQAGLLVDDRDPDGRAFVNHAPEHVQRLMADAGFALSNLAEIAAPAADTRWRILQFDR